MPNASGTSWIFGLLYCYPVTIWMKVFFRLPPKKKFVKYFYHFIQISKFLVRMYLMFLSPQMNIFNKKNLFASTINLIHNYYGFGIEFVVCFLCQNFFFFPLCAQTEPLLDNGWQRSPPPPQFFFFLIISTYVVINNNFVL